MTWIHDPIDMVSYVRLNQEIDHWPKGAMIRCTQSKDRYSVTLRSADDSIEHKFWGDVAKAKAWIEKHTADAPSRRAGGVMSGQEESMLDTIAQQRDRISELEEMLVEMQAYMPPALDDESLWQRIERLRPTAIEAQITALQGEVEALRGENGRLRMVAEARHEGLTRWHKEAAALRTELGQAQARIASLEQA